MKILNSVESKEHLQLLFNFARQMLGGELAYSPTVDVMDRVSHPLSIYASAVSDDGKEMLAFVSLAITTDHYYHRLLKGEVKEEEFEPWDDKDTPVLFLRNLVVKDRRATPYIFRAALKELHATCAKHDIYIHRAFTIATHWSIRRALESFHFAQTGLYHGKYPVMLASRDTSIILNSFLKQY